MVTSSAPLRVSCRLGRVGPFAFDASVPPNKETGIIFFTMVFVMDLSKEIDFVYFLSLSYPS